MEINKKIGELEALLFLYSDSLTIGEISRYLNLNEYDTNIIINQYESILAKEESGLNLLKFGRKIQLTTKAIYSDKLKEMINPPTRKTLSQAMAECLIIIAMHQPALKAEVENIRGVKSDSSIARLQEMGLIKIHDRMDSIGRPFRYATTDDFLKHFGFHSIEEFQQTVKLQSSADSKDEDHED